jgi:hypothetical protein
MTVSKILPVSNSTLTKIIDAEQIGVQYDSEFISDEETVILWEGVADAYQRIKNVRVYSGDTVTNVQEITILIPRLVELSAGCVLTLTDKAVNKTYKVNDYQNVVQDIGVGDEFVRCYVNEVIINEPEEEDEEV